MAQILIYILTFSAFFLSTPAWAKNPLAFEEANRDFQKGKFEDALKKYQELQKQDPSDADLQYNLGNTHYRLGQYPQADEAYKKALNSQDKKVRKESLYNLGNSRYRQNQLQEALDYYEKALQIDPGYENARLNSEFVKKKLEEQKQQKQDQKQDQNQQQQQDQQKQDNQQSPSGSSQDSEQQQNQNEKQKNDQEQQGQSQSEKEQQENQNQQNSQNQKGQQEQNDKDSQNQEEQQKQKSEQEKAQEEKSNEQQNKEQQKQDEQKQDENGKSAAQEEKKPEQDHDGRPDSLSDAKNFKGKFDHDPYQWLESVTDDPSTALKYLIEKKSLENPSRSGKDW